MNPCAYVLKSINFSKSYVGSTTDLARRLKEHNAGFSTFSKKYMPWQLVYKEECKNLNEARKHEKYLKSAVGRRFIKKTIFKNSAPR